MFLLTE